MPPRHSITRPAAAVSAVLLGACTAIPTVQYTKLGDETAHPGSASTRAEQKGTEATPQPENISDSFYLARSEITIDRASETEEKTKMDEKTRDLLVISRPVAYDEYKIDGRKYHHRAYWRSGWKVDQISIGRALTPGGTDLPPLAIPTVGS
jgi:hypothetical protein